MRSLGIPATDARRRVKVATTLAVLVVVTASLSACGGGSSSDASAASAAPTSASKSDFCGALKVGGSDVKPSQLAASMKSVGTPDGISESARRGFEVLVDKLSTIDSSNPSDADIAKLAQAFKAGDLADVKAFITYYVQECSGSLPTDGAS
jgi:hypothetical protein